VRKAGTRDPGTPSARPTGPRLWPPASGLALTTIHDPDVCPHIFVGGDRTDVAWWVLNCDSEDMTENMPAVQTFAP
jgi:hypothetical protein